MELPANPNQLFLDAYNEFGQPYTDADRQKQINKNVMWQLEEDSSESDDDSYDQSTAFGIEGGYY